MKPSNLTDKEYKELKEKREKNIDKDESAIRIYKHPIKNRTVLKSTKQIRDTRRG
jgi:CRISPR/Cas system-associated endoribonuclease Cas2